MIERNKMLEQVNRHLRDPICDLYKLDWESMVLHPEYEGCQNIIFYYKKANLDYVLRFSYRDDRSFEQIVAETHFINFLYDHGVLVSRPVRSEKGHFVELCHALDQPFILVAFHRAKGIRLPDNQYQYRDGVSIDEYFYNYGKTLGKMHRLARTYRSLDAPFVRPDWLETMRKRIIPQYLPQESINLARKMHALCEQAAALPKERDAYGLIHADFGDGNFTIDYQTGDLTVFDFDDCAYSWFMYDLADAWSKGVGWTMFEACAQKRRQAMDRYFDQVLTGYFSENNIGEKWLNRLPFFLKLVEMEWILSEFQFLINQQGQIDYDQDLLYRIKCMEEDIPYLGFFDAVYSAENPFCLS